MYHTKGSRHFLSRPRRYTIAFYSNRHIAGRTRKYKEFGNSVSVSQKVCVLLSTQDCSSWRSTVWRQTDSTHILRFTETASLRIEQPIKSITVKKTANCEKEMKRSHTYILNILAFTTCAESWCICFNSISAGQNHSPSAARLKSSFWTKPKRSTLCFQILNGVLNFTVDKISAITSNHTQHMPEA